jgi:adenylate kinase
MEENITTIKNWLGTGSINIFGLPLSGKDTVGIRLAETIGGRFLSSGMILREAEKTDRELRHNLESGLMAQTEKFFDLVLPYFQRQDLGDYPLILGGIGRLVGEEGTVMQFAEASGHPIKAVMLLNISEADIHARWDQSRVLQDRGERADDKDRKTLNVRMKEFHTKTMPVIQFYRHNGLLVSINADQPKDAVFNEVINKLTDLARSQGY